MRENEVLRRMNWNRKWIQRGLILGGWLLCHGMPQTGHGAEAPTPSWIWGSADAQREAASGQCEFRRRFQLSASATQAQLELSCDDRYVLRVNGRVIGLGANWKQWEAYDVTPLLREGENEISLRCRNDSSAAGLVVRLRAKLEDGTTQLLVSDSQWEARLQRAGTWDPNIVNRTPWEAAHEVQAYGGGPWNQLEAATSVRKIRVSNRNSSDPFHLVDGDRVLFLGNTFIERAQKFGHLEAALTCAFPGRQVTFRNLGWSGDTVFGIARARFGSVQDGFQHLETHVFGEQPTVVFVAYGTNESYRGKAGLPEFTRGLEQLVDVVSASGAYVILMTPIPHESLGPPLPDAAAHNDALKLYRDAIVALADEKGCGIVDFFERLPQVKQAHGVDFITENGMHLGDLGYWYASQALLEELRLETSVPQVAVDVADSQVATIGAEVQNLATDDRRVAFQYQPDRVRIGVPTPPTATTPVEAAAVLLKVQGLNQGAYSLVVDGKKVAQGSAEDWARGISVPTSDQPAELLQAVCKKNELYFHRWRPQNETYLFLFRKHEQGNNAVEIPQFDPLIENVEESIATLKVPRQQSFELVPE